jgi:hypothetical protein
VFCDPSNASTFFVVVGSGYGWRATAARRCCIGAIAMTLHQPIHIPARKFVLDKSAHCEEKCCCGDDSSKGFGLYQFAMDPNSKAGVRTTTKNNVANLPKVPPAAIKQPVDQMNGHQCKVKRTGGPRSKGADSTKADGRFASRVGPVRECQPIRDIRTSI